MKNHIIFSFSFFSCWVFSVHSIQCFWLKGFLKLESGSVDEYRLSNYGDNLTIRPASKFFQSLHPMFVSQKSGRKMSSSVYFRRLSAMYATAPMMHAATTAMMIASSVVISGVSVGSGSGSSGVGCSGSITPPAAAAGVAVM
jgi:hypothetical protein